MCSIRSDIYVVVKLRALSEAIQMDAHELMGARWMGREEIESKLAAPGEKNLYDKVSAGNWKVIVQVTSITQRSPARSTRPTAHVPPHTRPTPTNA